MIIFFILTTLNFIKADVTYGGLRLYNVNIVGNELRASTRGRGSIGAIFLLDNSEARFDNFSDYGLNIENFSLINGNEIHSSVGNFEVIWVARCVDFGLSIENPSLIINNSVQPNRTEDRIKFDLVLMESQINSASDNMIILYFPQDYRQGFFYELNKPINQ
ncbi:MAG: hypothetical protein R3F46_02620 [bacterium]